MPGDVERLARLILEEMGKDPDQRNRNWRRPLWQTYCPLAETVLRMEAEGKPLTDVAQRALARLRTERGETDAAVGE